VEPKANGVKRTRAELRAARRAAEAMEHSVDHGQYIEAWQSFLDRVEKVWRMAVEESKAGDTATQPWFGKFQRLRKDDALLRYLQHARNADQHSVQMVALHSPVGITVQLPPHSSVKLELDRSAGQLRVTGHLGTVDRLPAQFVCLPVSDRGVVYNPPVEHRGRSLSGAEPSALAEAALTFLEDMVDQFEERLAAAG